MAIKKFRRIAKSIFIFVLLAYIVWRNFVAFTKPFHKNSSGVKRSLNHPTKPSHKNSSGVKPSLNHLTKPSHKNSSGVKPSLNHPTKPSHKNSSGVKPSLNHLTKPSHKNSSGLLGRKVDERRPKTRVSKPISGELNVHIWRKVCGEDLPYLRQSPFYPRFPDEKLRKLIITFQFEDNSLDYGQLIFGYLKPPNSGSYRFAIASDDASELWLSPSEDSNQKELIARVFDQEGGIAWTSKNQLDKYPYQISKALDLHEGREYYIEVIHKQGAGNGFLEVYWKSSNAKDFKLITGEHFSPYSDDNSVTGRKDALHSLFSGHHSQSLDQKYKTTSNDYLKFFSLPLIPKGDYLATCDYKTSSVFSGKLYQYESLKMVRESNVYPEDNTTMGDLGTTNTWPNQVADRDIILAVANKVTSSLRLKTPKEYVLKRIHKVIQKSDPVYGDRFSVDLELGLNSTNQTFRLSEHVYSRKISGDLCFPEGIDWNSTATVYFILPVKNQGRWVYHFINELTVASLLTGDTNFHVIVVDFESWDIDMVKAFNSSHLLRSRHTLVSLKGKFYKTLAINKAVESVPGVHDIVFLFDLHIDMPIDIIDSVRRNTIEGKIVYSPVVGRLVCGSTYVDHRGLWQTDGFGLLGVYKSDWIRFGGMNTWDYKYNWGGEDWDLLDRIVNAKLEVERIRHPGLYHHYHTRQNMWSEE